jgi:RNA polymerase sigma-70 factor, ECF subfamily
LFQGQVKQNAGLGVLKAVKPPWARTAASSEVHLEAAVEVSDEVEERLLVERCRAGDDRAFADLVERYKGLVYGLVYRMVADRTQADDLAQEVFLKVHRGLPYFRGEARLSTWIFRIVQNVCVQARSRRPRVLSLDERDEEGRAARPEPGIQDGAFAGLELRDRLEKAIAQLPDQYRMLIAAHYLNGVQYEALAEALEMPLGTVKTHLYRAKRRLRELLDT